MGRWKSNEYVISLCPFYYPDNMYILRYNILGIFRRNSHSVTGCALMFGVIIMRHTEHSRSPLTVLTEVIRNQKEQRN